MTRCCRQCKSAYGTCLSRNYQCRCHRLAAHEDHKPPEYRDPTGEEAINRVMRTWTKRNRQNR